MSTNLRRERNSVSSLMIDLVCLTKFRRSIFTKQSLLVIEHSFQNAASKMNVQILEFNGETDHFHTRIEFPPILSISQMVNALKGVSSRIYRKAPFPKPYGKEAFWSLSYCVSFVGGATLEILKKYIATQEKPS